MIDSKDSSLAGSIGPSTDPSADLVQLRGAAADVQRRIQALELQLPKPPNGPFSGPVQEIKAVTEGLFGATPRVDAEFDPDDPGSPWLVFRVTSSASIPTILQLERQWHERVAAIAPASPLCYRLGVEPL